MSKYWAHTVRNFTVLIFVASLSSSHASNPRSVARIGNLEARTNDHQSSEIVTIQIEGTAPHTFRENQADLTRLLVQARLNLLQQQPRLSEIKILGSLNQEVVYIGRARSRDRWILREEASVEKELAKLTASGVSLEATRTWTRQLDEAQKKFTNLPASLVEAGERKAAMVQEFWLAEQENLSRQLTPEADSYTALIRQQTEFAKLLSKWLPEGAETKTKEEASARLIERITSAIQDTPPVGGSHGWRSTVEVAQRFTQAVSKIESAGVNAAAFKRRAQLSLKALAAANSQQLLTEMEALPPNFDGLNELNGWCEHLDEELVHWPELGPLKNALIAAAPDFAQRLERSLLEQTNSFGSTHHDIPDLLQLADEQSVELSEVGLPEIALRLSNAATNRARALAAASINEYKNEIALLAPSEQARAELALTARKFDELQAVFPEMAAYAEAARTRAVDMQQQAKTDAFRLAGLNETVAQHRLLIGSEVMTLGLLVERLAVAGHRLDRLVQQAVETTWWEQAKIWVGLHSPVLRLTGFSVTLHSGEEKHFRLAETSTVDGITLQPQLIAVGGGAFVALTPEEWTTLAQAMIEPPPHGVPDADGQTLADRLVGEPGDPQGIGPGVDWNSIDAQKAFPAALAAMEYAPGEPRRQFLYGRALLALGEAAECEFFFTRAFESGHAIAGHYLGEIKLAELRNSGLENPDLILEQLEKIEPLYQPAVEKGFAPSLAQTDSFQKIRRAIEPDFSIGYSEPKVMEALYTGNFELIGNRDRAEVLPYLVHAIGTVNESLPPSVTNGVSMVAFRAMTGKALDSPDNFARYGLEQFGGFLQQIVAARENPGAFIGRMASGEDLRRNAQADMIKLVQTTGPESPRLKRFFENMKRYLSKQ